MPDNNGLVFGSGASGDWYWDAATGRHSTELAAPAPADAAPAPSPPADEFTLPPVDPRFSRVESPPSDSVDRESRQSAFPADKPVATRNDAAAGFFDGMTIADTDRPLFDSFAAVLAREGVPATAGRAIAQWVAQQQTTMAREQQAVRSVSEAELRREWGFDFGANLTRAQNVIVEHADEETANAILGARLPSGEMLADNLGVMRLFLKLSDLTTRPAAPAPPPPAGATNIHAELAELESLMGNHRSRYWRGSDADRLQARYRSLLELRDGAG